MSVTAGVKETEETKVIQITEPETEPETEGDRELLRIEKDGKIPSYLTGGNDGPGNCMAAACCDHDKQR